MKLSDALRGAADRAPMDDATIPVSSAITRVRRHRAARAGSTGLVGAGAVAVIAVGAMGPMSADDSADSLANGDVVEESAMDGDMSAPAIAGEDSSAGGTRLAEQWMCGSSFDAQESAWAWGDGSGVVYSAGDPEADGEDYLLPSTLVARQPVDLLSAPDYVVVWDGIVVGRMVYPDPVEYGPADEPTVPDEVYERLDPDTDFSTLEQSTVLDPVNCWDGEPLPAGTYEVHQALTLAYADTADAGAPSGEAPPVEDVPAVEPTAAPTEDAGEGVDEGSDAIEPSVQSDLEVFRVAADPVSLTIDGDPVKDPFGAYLGREEPVVPQPLPEPIDPIAPQPLPDGSLNPDVARTLFDANRVDGVWDMAAGTQRVVKANDSRADDPDGDWQESFYGCVWDSSVEGRFPESSADLDLLDVSVALPSSISVSYGFVVDDNPLVTSTVTNSSGYAIPGYWGGATPQLYLVKDGRVAAEAYPTALDRQPAILERGREPGDDAAGALVAPVDGGVLEPGDSLSGRFLWRDISGCGAAGSVAPGTYTVLAAQTISLTNEVPVVMYGEGEAGAIGGSAEPGADVIEPAIGAAPDAEPDWLELQIYTSLGALTVR